jgi:hypothetical protein
VSRTAHSKLFRQRTGKRVYATSPSGLNNDCDTRLAEKAHAEIKGGDMCPTKERNPK